MPADRIRRRVSLLKDSSGPARDQRLRRVVLIVLAVATCPLLFPAVSLGALVELDSTGGLGQTELRVTDSASEPNHITVTIRVSKGGVFTKQTATVEDSESGRTLTAGDGCTQGLAGQVECDVAIGGINTINLSLGGGNDSTSDGDAGSWALPRPAIVDGGSGQDLLEGSLGPDAVIGGEGPDLIAAGPGNDVAFGNGGNDRLLGGKGNDELTGGDGSDRLVGRGGRDVFHALDGFADVVDCGPGTDDASDRDEALDSLVAPVKCETR